MSMKWCKTGVSLAKPAGLPGLPCKPSLDYFHKLCFEIFTLFKVIANPTTGPVYLELSVQYSRGPFFVLRDEVGNHPLLVFYCQEQAFGMAALMHSLRYEDRQQYVRFALGICLAKLQLRLLEAILLIVFLKRKGSTFFNVEISRQKNCLRSFLKYEVYKLDIVIYFHWNCPKTHNLTWYNIRYYYQRPSKKSRNLDCENCLVPQKVSAAWLFSLMSINWPSYLWKKFFSI